ncbi:MAG TPA: hypothetical protein VFB26_11785, partial [Gaiellaceae bacterium]|nr:hypothetical protein [Gaiellaceae bacterium]
QRARGRRPWTPAELDADLIVLVDRVTRRLRAAGRAGRTVVLRLRFGDYTRATRSHTLPLATTSTHVVLTAARALLSTMLPVLEQRGVTLVGVSVTGLEQAEPLQPALPLDGRDDVALDGVVDEIRERFGRESITRAVLL